MNPVQLGGPALPSTETVRAACVLALVGGSCELATVMTSVHVHRASCIAAIQYVAMY